MAKEKGDLSYLKSSRFTLLKLDKMSDSKIEF